MPEDICRWEDGELIRCSKNTVKTIRDNYCKYCGADLRKPKPEIEPGMFGRFFESKTKFSYGYLDEITDEEFYIDQLGDSWPFFEPGLPDGVNQDGTVG